MKIEKYDISSGRSDSPFEGGAGRRGMILVVALCSACGTPSLFKGRSRRGKGFIWADRKGRPYNHIIRNY